jgi:hypothetical protein
MFKHPDIHGIIKFSSRKSYGLNTETNIHLRLLLLRSVCNLGEGLAIVHMFE